MLWLAALICCATAADHTDGVSLALSGGGARGLAHVGVLRAFEEEGVRIRGIAGTSMGALVGGLYACGFSASQLDSIVRSLDWDFLFSSAEKQELMPLPQRISRKDDLVTLSVEGFSPILPQSAISAQRIGTLLTSLTGPIQIERGQCFDSLAIPLRVVSFDLRTKGRVVHQAGELARALLSSMAIPSVFPAVSIGYSLLVDGGVVNNLPSGVAEETWHHPVIAVDVSSPPPEIPDDPTLLEVGRLTFDALTTKVNEQYERAPSYYIRPDLQDATIWSFDDADSLMTWGYASAKQFLQAHPELRGGSSQLASFRVPSLLIRNVQIGGLKTYPATSVLPWLRIRRGDRVTSQELRDATENIFASGLFRRVEPRLLPLSRPGEAELVFELEERPPGSLGFGITYHSDFGLDGRLTLDHRNFLNVGRKLLFSLGGGDGYIYSEAIVLDLTTSSRRFRKLLLSYGQMKGNRHSEGGGVSQGVETWFSTDMTQGVAVAWDGFLELGIGAQHHRWGSEHPENFLRAFGHALVETYDDRVNPGKGLHFSTELSLNAPFTTIHSTILRSRFGAVKKLPLRFMLSVIGWGQLAWGTTYAWQYSRLTAANSLPGIEWNTLASRERIAGKATLKREFLGPFFISLELGGAWDWDSVAEIEGVRRVYGTSLSLGVDTAAGPAVICVGRSSKPETRWTVSVGTPLTFGPGR